MSSFRKLACCSFVVSVVLAALAPTASAVPTCSYDSSTKTATLTLEADTFPRVFIDDSDRILVDANDGAGSVVQCGAATAANTDLLSVAGVAGELSYEGISVDQEVRPFGVPIAVSNLDEFELFGSDGAELVRAGELAGNLVIDLDEDGKPNATIERGELRFLDLRAGGGSDTIDTRGFATASGQATAVTALPDGTALDGEAGDDTIFGTQGEDFIEVGGGENTATGGDGDDDIRTIGSSSTQVDGGTGADRVRRSTPGDVVLTDERLVAATAPDAPEDRLISIEEATISSSDPAGVDIDAGAFSGEVTVAGHNGDDRIVASIGGGLFLGGAGDDQILAGPGNDDVRGDADFDTVSYELAPGAVTATLSVGPHQTGSSGVDGLTQVEAIVGSGAGDTLTGDGSRNVLDGADGDDTLNGLGGRDLLIGGDGTDTLNGGGGRDRCRTGEIKKSC